MWTTQALGGERCSECQKQEGREVSLGAKSGTGTVGSAASLGSHPAGSPQKMWGKGG